MNIIWNGLTPDQKSAARECERMSGAHNAVGANFASGVIYEKFIDTRFTPEKLEKPKKYGEFSSTEFKVRHDDYCIKSPETKILTEKALEDLFPKNKKIKPRYILISSDNDE
jgi:hypothetical protein